MALGNVYLLPNVLQDDEQALKAIPPYVLDTIKKCDTFFAENEKVVRRFFKRLWKEMVIDSYQWFTIHKAEDQVKDAFVAQLKNGRNIGIISDAGCPGIADPGQILIDVAQTIGARVHPLVGPSSILLALMASGMNGQQFQFNGYLPIENLERKKAILSLENDAQKRNCTQIFIETPYRNNSLVKEILVTCQPNTKLCIAVDITAEAESIKTKTIRQWKKENIELHKRPAIFLLSAY
ncbi:SAM-dependent methyltransferase [Arachidicoccus sp.]|jgi:16S rRNA (cytidine1402-2'-O)-methyltransferase|uniref:SAM-dependent methyltransferase n=1 Tax=Arachidicoccus sp. TaxID=1872624 RepID=UPI003D1B39FD